MFAITLVRRYRSLMAALSEMPEVVDPREVTLGALFTGFLKVALSGFGGVLAWAQRMVVEDRRWLSNREFLDLLSLCQFLPGPNIVNVSIALGARFQGPLGSIAAFSGLMIAPVVIVLLLGALYATYGQTELVRGAFTGIAAAAAGLALSMGVKLALSYRHGRIGLVFGALAFGAVGILHLPLAEVLLVLAPVSIAVAWMRRS
jgi:chromate transporter